jgi:hypothetical protein
MNLFLMNDVDGDEFIVSPDDVYFFESSLVISAEGEEVKKEHKFWVVLKLTGKHWEVTKDTFKRIKVLLGNSITIVKG